MKQQDMPLSIIAVNKTKFSAEMTSAELSVMNFYGDCHFLEIRNLENAIFCFK